MQLIVREASAIGQAGSAIAGVNDALHLQLLADFAQQSFQRWIVGRLRNRAGGSDCVEFLELRFQWDHGVNYDYTALNGELMTPARVDL